jgi:hypothetical protein
MLIPYINRFFQHSYTQQSSKSKEAEDSSKSNEEPKAEEAELEQKVVQIYSKKVSAGDLKQFMNETQKFLEESTKRSLEPVSEEVTKHGMDKLFFNEPASVSSGEAAGQEAKPSPTLSDTLKAMRGTVAKRVAGGFVSGVVGEAMGSTTKTEQTAKFGAILEKIVDVQESKINSFIEKELQNNPKAVKSLIENSNKLIDIVNNKAGLGEEEKQTLINAVLTSMVKTWESLWNPAEFEKKQQAEDVKKEKQTELKKWKKDLKKGVGEFAKELPEQTQQRNEELKAAFDKAAAGPSKYASRAKEDANQHKPHPLQATVQQGLRTAAVGSIDEVVKGGLDYMAKNLVKGSPLTGLAIALTAAVVTSVIETGDTYVPSSLSSPAATAIKIEKKEGEIIPIEDKNLAIAIRVTNAMLGFSVVLACNPATFTGTLIVGVVAHSIIDMINPLETSNEYQIELAKLILKAFPELKENIAGEQADKFLLDMVLRCPDEDIKKELILEYNKLVSQAKTEVDSKVQEGEYKKDEKFDAQLMALVISSIIILAIHKYRSQGAEESTVDTKTQTQKTKESMVNAQTSAENVEKTTENVKKAVVVLFYEEIDFIRNNKVLNIENPSQDPIGRMFQVLQERQKLIKNTLDEYSEKYEDPSLRAELNRAAKTYLSEIGTEKTVLKRCLQNLNKFENQPVNLTKKQVKKLVPEQRAIFQLEKTLQLRVRHLEKSLESKTRELSAVHKAREDLAKVQTEVKTELREIEFENREIESETETHDVEFKRTRTRTRQARLPKVRVRPPKIRL